MSCITARRQAITVKESKTIVLTRAGVELIEGMLVRFRANALLMKIYS